MTPLDFSPEATATSIPLRSGVCSPQRTSDLPEARPPYRRCTVLACTRKHHAKGVCMRHYNRRLTRTDR